MSGYFGGNKRHYFEEAFGEDAAELIDRYDLHVDGRIGGYYDEEAGYDDVAWDIEKPEFHFDDERPLFEFDPISDYYDLRVEEYDNNVVIMTTYQALGKLAEMTAKLLVAWEKRAAADQLEKQDPSLLLFIEDDDGYPLLEGLNLYQLEMDERSALRSHSVLKLETLFGGKEEVMKLRQFVDDISKFLKRIIHASVSNSLPYPMPYPVVSNILSYLLPVRGAVNIGLVTNADSHVGEIRDMESLYLAMATVFDSVKVIMFTIELIALETELSITEMKEMLVEKFEGLVATVASSDQLQISLEGLDIKDIEASEEEVA